MRLFPALIGLSLATIVAATSYAQTPPTQRVRGKITSVSADTMEVATREGPTLKVALGANLAVALVEKTDISAIAKGTYIGTAARPGPNGTLDAVEVTVFPESARGGGEGHYAWDLAPETSMTNATVNAVVDERQGRDLELTYKGGTQKVRVGPDTPIVTFGPGTRGDLKPGASVFFSPTKGEGGTMTASRINVGKDGLVPPM